MRAGVIWGWFGVRWGGVCGVESTRTDGGRAGGARDWGGGKGPVGYTAPEPQKERNERTDGRTDDDDDNYRMYKRAAFSPHSLQTHVFVLLFWPPKVLSVDFLRAGRRGGLLHLLTRSPAGRQGTAHPLPTPPLPPLLPPPHSPSSSSSTPTTPPTHQSTPPSPTNPPPPPRRLTTPAPGASARRPCPRP